MHRRSRSHRLLGTLLGLGLCLATPAGRAAENLVFVSGAFRRSIAVADLDHLARTGEARGLLGDVLSFSNQNPADVAKLLNQSVSLPITLVSRLLNTRIGEAILQRVAQIVHPLKASKVGVPALRSAVVMALAEGKGSVTALSFLRAYPSQEIQVSIPALLSLMNKAQSITDLVRFFSESPLDGLKGSSLPEAGAAKAAKPEP